MAISALQKFFVPPVFASLAAFSAMTIPLGLLGDKIIEIKLEQEPFFYGRVREGAIAYVIGATAISLGMGVSIAGISGWQASARKSSKIEEKVSSLEKQLQEKEELIKELSLSESRLQIAGLTSFLDNEVPFNSSVNSQNTFSQPVLTRAQPQAYRSPVNGSAKDTQPNTGKLQATIVKNSDIQELQQQIEQMMLQMQAMQNNLEIQTPPKQLETTNEKFKVYYETPVANEVHFQRC